MPEISREACSAIREYQVQLRVHRHEVIYQPMPATVRELQAQARLVTDHERAMTILGRASRAEAHDPPPEADE